ncbi:MAG: ribosome recycling factor [Bacteroidetes bacterium]|nr:ribosome recycling factor [Bacteroidota bacterium]
MSVSQIISELRGNLEKNLQHTLSEFNRLRAGKASPDMLGSVMVEYYGAMSPLAQLANVSTPDSRTLVIQPWDKSLIRPVETAIINANLGFAPSNDGDTIRINIPPVTEERRKELVKLSKQEAEHGKVGIRNLRKEANEKIKKLQKDGLSEDDAKAGEEEVQKLIDAYIKKTDEATVQKEKEIMTV